MSYSYIKIIVLELSRNLLKFVGGVGVGELERPLPPLLLHFASQSASGRLNPMAMAAAVEDLRRCALRFPSPPELPAQLLHLRLEHCLAL